MIEHGFDNVGWSKLENSHGGIGMIPTRRRSPHGGQGLTVVMGFHQVQIDGTENGNDKGTHDAATKDSQGQTDE